MENNDVVCQDYIARMKQLDEKMCNKFGLNTVKVKRLSENALLPTKNLGTDAGWDLYSSEDVILRPQERLLIKTGISMEIPNGYCGLIWPRSGLSVKCGVDVLAGVIDCEYRGEVGVCLFNTDTHQEVRIKSGDRIAQILLEKVQMFAMVEVDELNDSYRGDKGFGSSGR